MGQVSMVEILIPLLSLSYPLLMRSLLIHKNRGARGSMPETMALFNRQGIECTNFLDTVTKFYAILRGLISQGGNALFKITFYLFALLGWEAEECHAALVEVRRNRATCESALPFPYVAPGDQTQPITLVASTRSHSGHALFMAVLCFPFPLPASISGLTENILSGPHSETWLLGIANQDKPNSSEGCFRAMSFHAFQFLKFL